MKPKYYRIADHLKGDYWDGLKFTIKDTVSNVPLDLTGCTVKIQFKKSAKTGSLVEELTDTSGITVTALTGVIQMNGFKVDWDADIYYWDLQIVFPDDRPITYIEGTITITQDTTD